MHRSSTWVRRGLLLALLAALVVGAAARRRTGTGAGVLPVIGGDTWPPVPIKDARSV